MVICIICGKEFAPSKYRPSQKVCSKVACQKMRQLQNEKKWRQNNPEYFRTLGQDESWKKIRSLYNKNWRQTHKDYLTEYSKEHSTERRQYMKNYMQKYRSSVNRGKS